MVQWQRRFVQCICCTFLWLLIGCDDSASTGSNAPIAALPGVQSGPSFEFLLDGKPMEPSKFKEIEISNEPLDVSELLATAQLKQIATRFSQEQNFQDELHQDLSILSGAASKRVRGNAKWLALNLCTEDGTALHSWRLIANYAAAFREAASDEVLSNGDSCRQAGNAFLQLGYVLFDSPSDQESDRSRILVWGACWSAAFGMYARAAEIDGDKVLEAKYRRWCDEVVSAQKYLLSPPGK